jgi:hypothetical protein
MIAAAAGALLGCTKAPADIYGAPPPRGSVHTLPSAAASATLDAAIEADATARGARPADAGKDAAAADASVSRPMEAPRDVSLYGAPPFE